MQTCVVLFTLFLALYCTISVQGQNCVKNGKTYSVKQGWFITDKCRSKCRCLKSGILRCRPLCKKTPKKPPRCQSDEELKTVELPKGKNRQCFCTVKKCVSTTVTTERNTDTCIGPDRRTYKKGALFIPRDCSGKCNCLDKPKDGKEYSCKPLCPVDNVKCLLFEELEEYDERFPGDCICRRRRCKPRVTGCHGNDNRFYPYNTKFVLEDCSGECICERRDSPPRCTGTVCPYMWVQCAYGEELDYYNKTFEGSGCVCERVRCVRENCYYSPDKKLYPLDKEFIPDDCSGRCRCRADGGYDCDPLCQGGYKQCGYNEETVYEDYDVYSTSGRRCQCQRVRCQKRATCTGPDGRQYPMGKEWIPTTCSGRCKCRDSGLGYECDGLCPATKTCPSNQREVYEDYYIENTRCTCRRVKCEGRATCTGPDGLQYPMGEEWIPTHCNGRCKCRENGLGYDCKSLCEKQSIQCAYNEQVDFNYYEYIPGTRCQCSILRCIPL